MERKSERRKTVEGHRKTKGKVEDKGVLGWSGEECGGWGVLKRRVGREKKQAGKAIEVE